MHLFVSSKYVLKTINDFIEISCEVHVYSDSDSIVHNDRQTYPLYHCLRNSRRDNGFSVQPKKIFRVQLLMRVD